MMHYDLLLNNRMLYSDHYHRCRRCGQGPLMASDGYRMVHCLNCGSYHSSSEPLDLGLVAFGERLAGWVKKARKHLARKIEKVRQGGAAVGAKK